ncbi:MAG: hypothetical protein JF615_13505, partial [Asticcacaulis sp.]|nr:hypothetical protein [Asticcacaulis sp.]
MTNVIGPVYPAPGGNDFTTDGNSSGRSLGQTRTYGGLSHYSSYYWGLSNIGAAMDGAIDSPGEHLTLASVSADGLTATWIGQTQAPDFGGPVYVQLTVSIVAATSGTAHWVSAGAQGLAGGPEEVVDVDESVGSFQVLMKF